MNVSTTTVVCLIINLLVPSLCFYLLRMESIKKILKAVILLLSIIIITLSTLYIKYNSDKQVNQLTKQLGTLKLDNINLNTKLERLLSIIKSSEITSPELLQNFLQYYVDHLNLHIDIKNYSEEDIPIIAIQKKYEGFYFLLRDSHEQAIKCFLKALEIYPNYYTAKLGLAITYQKKTFAKFNPDSVDASYAIFDEAEKLFKELQYMQRNLKINDETPYYLLAFMYLVIKRELGTSESLLIDALRINPNSAETFNILGLVKEYQFFKLRNEIYIKQSMAFYYKAIKLGYYISKSNMQRLEKGFRKLNESEMKKLLRDYFVINRLHD